MADVKWIKILTNIFDDEKILLIESLPEADSIIVVWFKLLCLAGKQNNKGIFMLNDKIAYTDEMLASIFRRPLSTIRLSLKIFEDFEMIQIIDKVITIPNWDKHQSLDALEKKKEYDRQYQRNKRLEQKSLIETNNRTTSYDNSATVGALDIDIEEDIDKELNIKENKQKKNTTFQKPTLEEVKAYCQERKNSVDAERFIAYYESNGWKVGRNPMKDWKMAIITWEKRDTPEVTTPNKYQTGGFETL